MKSFYHSTRSFSQPVTSKQAILEGIAPDGGLFVSDGAFDDLVELSDMLAGTYEEHAAEILGRLLCDFSAQELSGCVRRAYGSTFSSPAVTPVTPVGDDFLLELYHGPTSAFKDVALQMLPQLMGVARQGDGRDIMIVCATSGDTGKAALAGFAGVEGCGVTVFYPHGKVSDVQQLQMATQTGHNVEVCAVEGNFDDAQSEVKRIFGDRQLAGRLEAQGCVLSSANSINIGRLAPQVVYYFDAYGQLAKEGALKLGDPVDFYVPTGNFGDVLAGYYAKRLGLPVGRLYVCSNANDVLCDFLETGVYDRRRDFHKTISPSMDILISSNLERLLYYASDGDVELVSSLMDSLAKDGVYQVPQPVMDTIRETFSGGKATDQETRATIARAWNETGVLIDPHTAVAKTVLDATEPEGRVRVVLSTASPYKFSAEVLRALDPAATFADGFKAMDRLAALTHTQPPAQLSGLRSLPVRFTQVVERPAMTQVVEHACQSVFDLSDAEKPIAPEAGSFSATEGQE